MATNPLNLALRFLLELAALAAVGTAAWQLSSGLWRWVFAILVPVALAAAWATFGVAGDESRGDTPPIAVPGPVRLLMELAFFGLAVVGLLLIDQTTLAVVFGAVVVFHYAISWDRVAWLLRAGVED